MAGAAFKVAGTGADEDFTLADDALAAAPAYAAVGVHDNGAGFHEGVQNAFFHGVEIDFSAGGHDQEADGRCDFFALDDGGAQAQILQAAVVAGSQEGFIDLDAGALADRSDIVDKVGLCNDRDDGGEVDVIDLLKFGVGIAGETCLRFSAAVCGKVFKCDVVDFHEGGLCACFDAEVADCDAVAHGQGRHTGAGKLHGVIICTVGADLSYDGQDQVASGGAVCQCAGQVKAQGLGDQDPGGSGHHTVEVIGTSDAGAEGPQGTVCAGVAVRAEDQLSGHHMVFNHDLVTYARALVEGDAVCLGEIAHFFL